MYYGIIARGIMDKQKNINVSFKKLDLVNKELIIKYRSVGFYTSFGSTDDFYEEDGNGGERYIAWVKTRNENEFSAFHVLFGNQIIGQLELNLLNTDKSIGYINYYYLHEEYQGSGISMKMDEFVINYYRNQGINKMQLAVSPTNKRAYAYYEKCGWSFLIEKDYINKDGVNLGHKIHILQRSI